MSVFVGIYTTERKRSIQNLERHVENVQKWTTSKLYAKPKRKMLSVTQKQFGDENEREISLKEKDILIQVKINSTNLDMQIDTFSEVTLIPRKIWEQLGKSKLWKTYSFNNFTEFCYTNTRILWRICWIRQKYLK